MEIIVVKDGILIEMGVIWLGEKYMVLMVLLDELNIGIME